MKIKLDTGNQSGLVSPRRQQAAQPTNQPTNHIMTTTKTIKLTLNGFHGFQSHNVRSTWSQISNDSRGEALEYQVEIAESAARKFCCKSRYCNCGEGVPAYFTADGYDFEDKSVMIDGNHPRR